MDEKNMHFGEYIKSKRKNKQLTITQVADYIGLSKSHFCDIENKRRAPFDKDKMRLFAEALMLTDEETALLYDLAMKYNREVPYDIADIFMHEEVGEYARTALRLSKDSKGTEVKWKQLIRELEAEKHDDAKEKLSND